MPVKPLQMGTVLPEACNVGHMFFKTDAMAGKNIFACTSPNTWTLQASPVDVPAVDGQDGAVLAASGSAASWSALGGDVRGGASRMVVQGIQGRSVATKLPAHGELLIWNSATSQWEPGGVQPNYSLAFTSRTTVTIPGASHGYATGNLVVECYDLGDVQVEPDRLQINETTRDITVAFATPQSGRCVVNGGGAGGAGQLPAGTADGQVLSWSADRASWTGSDANGLQQVLKIVLRSPTELTIGAQCSAASPCNVRFGNTVHRLESSATVQLTAGTGAAAIYVDGNGAITVAHNLSLTCVLGCTAISGTPAYPSNVIPLATWTAVNGVWTNNDSDWRAWLSRETLLAGAGLIVTDTEGVRTVSLDPGASATVLSGNEILDFPTIPNFTCAADLTIPVMGASDGDTVAAGWPGTLAAGLIGTMRASTADVVAVRLCNFSGAAIDPAPATFAAAIVRRQLQ